MKKLFVLISLLFILGGFTALGTSTSFPQIVLKALASQSISAHALTDHECDNSEWHFVITQIDTQSHAPSSITVFWGATSQTVSLGSYTGKTAHYTTTSNLNVQVTSATATIYSGWSGQFNLSHGPCNVPNPTPTPTPSATPTPTPVVPTATPTPTLVPTATPTPTTVQQCPSGQTWDGGLQICISCDGGGTCEVNIGGTPTPTPTPTVTATPTPTETPAPTPTPTPGSNNNGGNSDNKTSSNNSTPSNTSSSAPSSSGPAILGANTFAGTGAFEDTLSNITLITGILTSGAGVVYGKKKSKKA